MNKIEVKVKKLNEYAITPLYATDGSAAADLYAALEAPIVIAPGERKLIPAYLLIRDATTWFRYSAQEADLLLKRVSRLQTASALSTATTAEK